MFICLFQSNHTSETQRDQEHPAVRRSALLWRQTCTRRLASVLCVSPNVSVVGPNLWNLFSSAPTELHTRKHLREASKLYCKLEGGEICLNLQNCYFCKNVAMQNVSTSLEESRSLAADLSFTSNTGPLLESLKGQAEWFILLVR